MPLANPALFFSVLRDGILGPKLEPTEVDGVNAIMDAFAGHPIADVAYALATAYLETGSSMQPVKEANWLSPAAAERYFTRMYDIKGERPRKARELGNLRPGDGALYAGRGYPQVTGGGNYREAAKVFGVPFDTNPDLMLQSHLAAKVMQHFMKYGLFTSRKLADTLPRNRPATRAEFKASRPIINGTDKAAEIAAFAIQFQNALLSGGYK